MNTPKPKKHLYLDTEVFNKYRFDLNNFEFELLFHLTSNDYEIYITRISEQEIRRQFKERKKQIDTGLKKLINSTRISKKYLKDYDKFSTTYKLDPYVDFENDFKKTNIKIVETYEQDISIKELFNDYFDSNPPFINGKKEFPDAFILNSIHKHIKDNNLKPAESVVISGNSNDFNEYCEINSINYFKDITSFSSWLKHKEYPEEYKKVKQIIEKRIQYLSKDIVATVEKEEFQAGYDDEWEDIAVEDVEVNLEHSGIRDAFMLVDFNKSKEKYEITIEVVCELDAKITYHGAHYDDAYYVGKQYIFNYKTIEEEKSIEVVAIVELEFDEITDNLVINKIEVPDFDSLVLMPEKEEYDY